MREKANRSLSAWEGRLAFFEEELDFYMEDPVSCCDICFFEEELASCRMALRDVGNLVSEERYLNLRSRVLHVERKVALLKERERAPWNSRAI